MTDGGNNLGTRSSLLVPRSPWWMPQPYDEETFADFWLRLGIPTAEIFEAITVDFTGAEDVANERLMQKYADRHPELLQRERRAWLGRMLHAEPA